MSSPAQKDDPKDQKSLGSNVIMRFAAGTSLVTENDVSRKMFIIKDGKARVYKNYLGRRITLAILGQGEVFGELSFFDGEPRSASVEALTDLTAIVVDADNVQKQLPKIPEWVFPILKMTIRRFRIADQKLAVLQSMNEYQKRTSQTDQEAKTIYLEILRFLKILKILHAKHASASPKKEVSSDPLLKEMDEVLGNRSIGLKTFWKTMKENDFIDHDLEENRKVVKLRQAEIDRFAEHLSQHAEQDNFLLLSHPAMSILRKLLGAIGENGLSQPEATVPVGALEIDSMPLWKEGMEELEKQGLIRIDDKGAHFEPGPLAETYAYQSVLKVFDHTSMNLE